MLELSGHIAMQEEAAFKLKIWPVTSFYNHGAVMFSSCSNDARNRGLGQVVGSSSAATNLRAVRNSRNDKF